MTEVQRVRLLEDLRIPPHLRFKFNADVLGDKTYTVLDKDGSATRTQSCLPLNRGNAGVVYKTLYKQRLERVIKFLDPDPRGDGQSKLKLEKLTANFKAEIQLLCELTHTHIVKIVDFGIHNFPVVANLLEQAPQEVLNTTSISEEQAIRLDVPY